MPRENELYARYGPRAALIIAAAANGLSKGELLLIDDESRFAVALSPSTYETFAKQSEAAGADPRETRLCTDFAESVAKQNDFTMAIIGTGSNFTTTPVAGALGPNHDGVVQWRSGTTANSGVYCATNLTSFRLGGGEQWDDNVYTPPAFATVLYRTGALNSITATAPVNGAYFEFNGSGAIVGKCRTNNVESVTAAIVTLAASTHYHLRVSLNAAGTLVTFSVYADNPATLLGQATLATNIPTAAGRELGWLSMSTSSGTVAIELCHRDRQKLSNPGRIMLRGAA